MVDMYLVYRFLKLLSSAFENWEAAKTGVIDKNGKIIVKKEQRTKEQKNSFSVLVRLARNIKLLLEKIPGGKTQFARYAAALYLIKESKVFNEKENNQLLEEINFERLKFYVEDAVTTSAVAGLDGNAVKRKEKKDDSDDKRTNETDDTNDEKYRRLVRNSTQFIREV